VAARNEQSTGWGNVKQLERILASKRAEIDALKKEELDPPTVRRGTLDVPHVLRRGLGDPLRVVAEIKRKSPSAGELSKELDVSARAEAYARGGAAMVSVLCDGPFFGGSWQDVARVRAAVDRLERDVAVLAKEFVLDEVQLDRARAMGADAVLLIARIVSPARLRELYKAARTRDLYPLVEVVNEAELATAVDCGAKVVGVNARDLDTLAIDPAAAARVIAAAPPSLVRVHLSGVKTDDDVRQIAHGPADAVLVGESLMRDSDPEPRLRAYRAAAAG
jgi:indole-3-glycerol phosphate synthase